jgi:hypothetical protein
MADQLLALVKIVTTAQSWPLTTGATRYVTSQFLFILGKVLTLLLLSVLSNQNQVTHMSAITKTAKSSRYLPKSTLDFAPTCSSPFML